MIPLRVLGYIFGKVDTVPGHSIFFFCKIIAEHKHCLPIIIPCIFKTKDYLLQYHIRSVAQLTFFLYLLPPQALFKIAVSKMDCTYFTCPRYLTWHLAVCHVFK